MTNWMKKQDHLYAPSKRFTSFKDTNGLKVKEWEKIHYVSETKKKKKEKDEKQYYYQTWEDFKTKDIQQRRRYITIKPSM